MATDATTRKEDLTLMQREAGDFKPRETTHQHVRAPVPPYGEALVHLYRIDEHAHSSPRAKRAARNALAINKTQAGSSPPVFEVKTQFDPKDRWGAESFRATRQGGSILLVARKDSAPHLSLACFYTSTF